MSVPAVWRTVKSQASSLQSGSMDDLEIPAFLRSQADDVALPAFLRKRDQIIDHQDPRYWAKSEHYEGLTPLGVSEWLRRAPASEWPTTYASLRQIGLGQWLVDWLELAVANQGATQHPERQVVEAFLHIMSKRDTYEALAQPEGLLGALKFTAQRMGGMFASNSAANPASINLTLIEAMLAVLDGMTASVWPDRVFSLGSAVNEVCTAREAANAA